MSIFIETDDTIQVDRNAMPSFRPPERNTNIFADTEAIMNRKHYSKDAVSILSGGSSKSSSVSGESRAPSEVDVLDMAERRGGGRESSFGNSYGTGNRDSGGGGFGNQGNRDNGDRYESSSGSASGSSESGSLEDYDGGGCNGDGGYRRAPQVSMEDIIHEKRNIIYELEKLKARGVANIKNFDMQSDLEEMKSELHKIRHLKEVEASIRFQRKMMMTFISGVEYLNGKFDPFDVRLDGWSENVNENIDDYDDIFEELHDKYKSSGKKMAPEIRLLLSLTGSAFMFHLTNSMFKKSNVPDVEEIIRKDPELLKRFQTAAAKNVSTPPSRGGNGGGLMGMFGNIFGFGSPPPPPPRAPVAMPTMTGARGMPMAPPPAGQPRMKGPGDIDSIINQIHGDIIAPPSVAPRRPTPPMPAPQQIRRVSPPSSPPAPMIRPAARIERMSDIDSEITSIIDETKSLLSTTDSKKKTRATARPAGRTMAI